MAKKILFLFLVTMFALTAFAQSGTSATGTVKDANGEPLIGVSVMIKGTNNGSITDLDGRFALNNAKVGDVLVFSYIGMKTQEVAWRGAEMNITLQDDTQTLDEVVVVGYGSQKKVNLTGSVASVDFNDEMLSRPVTTVSTALSGMVAGLNIMQTSSKPNSESASINIRGVGTLNDASPLILVDGMEMDLNQINPNDIASISVLKDAASCAIYGNRGANGVILVTTKQGTSGKINVTYSGKFSYNTPAKLIRQVSNYADYMEFINEAATNSGQAAIFNTSTIDKWREAAANPNGIAESGYPNYVAYPNTDWYDAVYNPKWMMEHTVTLTGAEKRTRYGLSATYVDNPGLASNSGMKKYYMRANLETDVTNFLTVGMRAWGYHTDQERNNIDDLNGNMMQKATPGTYPYYNGYYGVPSATEEDPVSTNPTYFIDRQQGYYKQSKYYVNPYVKVKFLKHFELDYNFYYDYYRREDFLYDAPYREQMNFATGIVTSTPPTSETLSEDQVYYWIDGDQSWKNNVVLHWNQVFKQKHDVSAMIGYEEYRKWRRTTDTSKKGMVDSSLTDYDTMTEPAYISGNTTEFSSRSLFARVNYAYDSRYLFEANMRYDGSSRFAPENRWGVFPSFSAGWRISEEGFLKDLEIFDNLKIRASWGKLGNNSIGNYEWQALYGIKRYVFGNSISTGVGMTSFSNYALEWESTAVTNVGLDFSVLRNRLSGTIEWYNKVTDGILYNPTLSPTLSYFGSPRENIAEVTNRGVELTLSWQDRLQNGFQYNVSGNFSFNKNEVSKYKGQLQRGWVDGVWTTNLGDVSTGGDTRVLEGHMMNEYYTLKLYHGNGSYFNADGTVNVNGGPKDGMIRTEQDMQWLQAMVDAGYQFYPSQGIGKDKIWYGDIIYADLNNDGVYGSENDKDFIGYSSTPKFYYGLQASASWKGFDLSMNWAGAAGFKIQWYTQTQNSTVLTRGYGIGKDIAYDHYFYDPENPNDPRTNLWSENTRLTMGGTNQTSSVSEWHLHNGNYMKLKNLTIGYSFPKKWLEKIYVQNLRVYASGENLLTITKFKGMDPETASGAGYPTMRQYAFGVNITF